MKCPVTVWWVLAGGPVPLAAQAVVRAAMEALVETIGSFRFAFFLASNKSRHRLEGRRRLSTSGRYFSDALMSLNFVFRVLPRPLTATIIAIEMPAAISPYSIAVAPDSSDRNFEKMLFNLRLLTLCTIFGRRIASEALRLRKFEFQIS
jgi:hypothetical protein